MSVKRHEIKNQRGVKNLRRKQKKNIRQPEQNVMTIGEFLLICFTWYPVMLIPVDCLLILQIAWENKMLLYAVREFV